MYFPIADIELSPLVPLAIGFAVSVISSPTGVSGGFLILPISLNFLEFTSQALSPTNYIFNAVSMPSGLWRLHREKRILWGLGALILGGSVPGILAGTYLRATWLKEAADFKIFVGLVLSVLALNLARSFVWGSFAAQRAERTFANKRGAGLAPLTSSYDYNHIRFHFSGESFSVSTPALMTVSLIVGLVGGIYGIGGAAIISPVLISLFNMPVYVASGAALMAGWASSLVGLFSYIFFWPWVSGQAPIYPDLKLGLLFGLGGLVGVYIGSAVQRFLPPKPLKVCMLIMIVTMAAQNLGLFLG